MTSNIKLLSFDGNRYGGLPKRSTSKVLRILSLRKTQCRNLIIGNRYDGLPKRFTSKSPRMISIRGFFRRNGKEAVTVLLTSFANRLDLLNSV